MSTERKDSGTRELDLSQGYDDMCPCCNGRRFIPVIPKSYDSPFATTALCPKCEGYGWIHIGPENTKLELQEVQGETN